MKHNKRTVQVKEAVSPDGGGAVVVGSSGKAPLTRLYDLTECVPVGRGKGVQEKPLIDVLDSAGYIPREPTSADWARWSRQRFPLLFFQGRLGLVREAAHQDPDSSAGELLYIIDDCLNDVRRRCAEPSSGGGWVVKQTPGLPGFGLSIAADVLHGVPQETVHRQRNRGLSLIDRLLAESDAPRGKRTISPQTVNYQIWHFLESIKERLPIKLVIDALLEAAAGEGGSEHGVIHSGKTQHLSSTDKSILAELWDSPGVRKALDEEAFRLFEDDFDREEAVACAWDKIRRKINRVADADDPRSYAVTVGESGMIDFWRRESRRRGRELPLRYLEEDSDDAPLD